MARPSKFTQKLADEICDQLAGGKTLIDICRSDDLPPLGTVRSWLWKNSFPEFSEAYARAREAQMDAWADEILSISDDGSNDWMERKFGDDEQSTWVINGEHVQRSRLRLDTRKFLMSKIKPQQYGDKVAVVGGDGGPVQYQEIERRVVKAGN